MKPLILFLFLATLLTAQEFKIDAEMRVVHRLVDFRAIKSNGEPLTGLTIADLELYKEGKPIELSSIYWMDSSKSYDVKEAEGSTAVVKRPNLALKPGVLEAGVTMGAVHAELGPGEADAWPEYTATKPTRQTKIEPKPLPSASYFTEEETPEGQLVVLFFQGEINGERRNGLKQAVKHAEKLLEDLEPNDFVAVVSFDSHLKLHLDFTRDRPAAKDALYNAQRQLTPDPISIWSNPGIAHYLDYNACRETASIEEALERVGRALDHLDGAKSMFFICWGVGEYRSYGPRTSENYIPALEALIKSRTTVLALDASVASSHSLAAGLKMVAQNTGGFYDSFYNSGSRVVRKVLNSVKGYYVLSFSDPYADTQGFYHIKLKNHKGDILIRNPFRAR